MTEDIVSLLSGNPSDPEPIQVVHDAVIPIGLDLDNILDRIRRNAVKPLKFVNIEFTGTSPFPAIQPFEDLDVYIVFSKQMMNPMANNPGGWRIQAFRKYDGQIFHRTVPEIAAKSFAYTTKLISTQLVAMVACYHKLGENEYIYPVSDTLSVSSIIAALVFDRSSLNNILITGSIAEIAKAVHATIIDGQLRFDLMSAERLKKYLTDSIMVRTKALAALL